MSDMNVGELAAHTSLDNKDFNRGLAEMERGLKSLQLTAGKALTGIEEDARKGGRGAIDQLRSSLGLLEDVAADAGRDGGRSLVAALDDALSGADGVAGKAGRQAGASFVSEAREMLRYGDLGVDIDADTAGAFAELEALGRIISDLDSRDVDVNVRADSSSAMSALDGLEQKAGGLGGVFDKALGVIGSSGPANVALVVGAIEMLPTVASVAATGIVFAVGGALAAVGITAAAQSDKVKHAWSELGDELKAELSDVAEPLEGSVLRAADVAETAFERLKPSLARIFSDLVPDVDHFVAMAGQSVGSLGPVLEKVGGSFGTMLSSLGDRMPVIIDNIGDSLETLSAMLDDDPQMLANLVEDATELVSVGAEVLSWADDIKAAVTLPFDATGASDKLFEAMFGATPEQIREDMGIVNTAIDGAILAANNAAYAARDLGAGSGEAAGGVRSLNDALENMFDPAAKALDAEIRLKQAIQEANQAAKDQKMTEIEKLSAVQDTTRAIADASKAEMERTGETTKAGEAFLAQLPHLQEWAGKNGAAKDTIAALGESLGITTIKTRDGTVAVDALGNAIKVLPNGKTVPIDADTAKGKQQIADLMLMIARQKGTIDVHVRTIYDSPSGQKAIQQKNKAAGGIERYASGGIREMAAGGRMSPPPHIADSPTILYGEGSGDEAFIPYDSKYRSRATDLLLEVADDFGLELMSKKASKKMSALSVTLDDSRTQLGQHFEKTTSLVAGTLGQSGTLIKSIEQVGTVGQSLVGGWTTGSEVIGESVDTMGALVSGTVVDMGSVVGGSVTGMSGAVATGSEKIVKSTDVLRDAALAVADAVSKAAAGTGKGSQGSVIPPAPGKGSQGTGKGSQGSVIPPAPGGSGRGSQGSVIPPPPPKPKAVTVGENRIAGMQGVDYMSTNASAMTNGAAASASGGVTVNIAEANVRTEADFGKLGAVFGFEYMAHA